MKQEYTSDELLPLSGIQHFHFCRRQWALIHIERQWQENVLTVEGRLMHQRADNPFLTEVRKGVVIARSMPVASYRLGLYGVCDVIEFTTSEEGVRLHARDGFYLPKPVEYKHGKEKRDACDEVQLCAQAICLEEMLSIPIPEGDLFYGETRRRVTVAFSAELRSLVHQMSLEMHDYFAKGHTPRVKPTKACQSCSLKDICLPEVQGKVPTASTYVRQAIEDET